MVLLFLLAKKTQGAVVTHTNESRNDTGKRKKGEHPSTQHSIIQMADSHQKTTVKSTMSCAPKHCNTTAQLDQLEGTNEWKKGFNYYVGQLHNDIQWLYNWIKKTSWISCFLDGLGMKSLWTSVLRISKPPDFSGPKTTHPMFFHPPGLPGLHEELRGHHVETGPERHDKHDIFLRWVVGVRCMYTYYTCT